MLVWKLKVHISKCLLKLYTSKKYIIEVTNNSRNINVNQSSSILKTLGIACQCLFFYSFVIFFKFHAKDIPTNRWSFITVHMPSSLHLCGSVRKRLSANTQMLKPRKLTHDNFAWHSLCPPPTPIIRIWRVMSAVVCLKSNTCHLFPPESLQGWLDFFFFFWYF